MFSNDDAESNFTQHPQHEHHTGNQGQYFLGDFNNPYHQPAPYYQPHYQQESFAPNVHPDVFHKPFVFPHQHQFEEYASSGHTYPQQQFLHHGVYPSNIPPQNYSTSHQQQQSSKFSHDIDIQEENHRLLPKQEAALQITGYDQLSLEHQRKLQFSQQSNQESYNKSGEISREMVLDANYSQNNSTEFRQYKQGHSQLQAPFCGDHYQPDDTTPKPQNSANFHNVGKDDKLLREKYVYKVPSCRDNEEHYSSRQVDYKMEEQSAGKMKENVTRQYEAKEDDIEVVSTANPQDQISTAADIHLSEIKCNSSEIQPLNNSTLISEESVCFSRKINQTDPSNITSTSNVSLAGMKDTTVASASNNCNTSFLSKREEDGTDVMPRTVENSLTFQENYTASTRRSEGSTPASAIEPVTSTHFSNECAVSSEASTNNSPEATSSSQTGIINQRNVCSSNNDLKQKTIDDLHRENSTNIFCNDSSIAGNKAAAFHNNISEALKIVNSQANSITVSKNEQLHSSSRSLQPIPILTVLIHSCKKVTLLLNQLKPINY